VKTLACPHCHTTIPDRAGVCTGCGAEIVRGLNRRERSIIGLGFVALAILIAVIILRAVEISHGKPALPSPKAENGLIVIAAFFLIVVVPFLIGSRVARLIGRSRIRFYRAYQHQ